MHLGKREKVNETPITFLQKHLFNQLPFLVSNIYRVQIFNKMIDFKDNFSSESFYPDSNYYLDQEKTSEKNILSEDQISKMGRDFKWPNSYWYIAERTNGRLAMIGFMAVIINYTLFGWIAYPIL